MASADEQLAAARLLHRAAFGPKPDQFSTAQEIGAERLKAQLINDVSAANKSRDDLRSPVPQLDYPDPLALGNAAARQRVKKQVVELQLWWLERMVTTEQPLLERMVWFLHGHWATSVLKVKDARFMLVQNQLLRSTAFSNFSDQAKGMLKDPAMLVWLDGQGNRVGHANENLGREFLELFALGVGNYTENDVKEASRALTGWTINYANATTSLRARNFDGGNKTVLGRTSNFTVDSLVDHVVGQDSHSRHMAERIWQRMVAPELPQNERTLITGYGSSHNLLGLMSATLDAITSKKPEPLAKAPVEWAVGVMKALDFPSSRLKTQEAGYLLDLLNSMGQLPLAPPSVGGWPTGQAWFSATATQARIDLARLLAGRADLGWVKKASAISRPSLLAERLGVTSWSPATSQALTSGTTSAYEAIVLAVNSPDYVVMP